MTFGENCAARYASIGFEMMQMYVQKGRAGDVHGLFQCAFNVYNVVEVMCVVQINE